MTNEPGHPPEPPLESNEIEERGGFSHRNQFFFSLLFPALLLGLGRGFTIPVLPVIAKDEFGAGVAGASLMVIAPMAGGVRSTLPTGYLIDRVGRRLMLIASPLVSSGAAFLVFFAATSYTEFLV